MQLSALVEEDGSAIEAQLNRQGLSSGAATSKVELFARAARTLIEAGCSSTQEAHAFFVPGRIEVLGKHTDYAGGSSIVAAVEQGFCLAAVPRDDGAMHVSALDFCNEVSFELAPDLEVPHGRWSNYPMTAARRAARNFPECRRGMHLAFCSDLPPAAGMSSSSALIVATFLALAAVNELSATQAYRQHLLSEKLELAAYLGCVENGQSFGELAGDRGVGTFGGSEDHTAILCSTAGHVGQFAYCPARFQRRIRLPDDTVLAVGNCGIQAEKTGTAQELYNRASLQVSALVQTWQRATGRDEVYLADILASGDGALEELRGHLAAVPTTESYNADELATRLDHFASESDLLGPAGDALAVSDLGEFGRLVDRSQQLSEDLLGNQIPETSGLARLARESGALAASGFGAGFGGSVWALVKRAEAADFLQTWRASYKRDFAAGSDSVFFHTLPGPAAFELVDGE